MGELWKGNRWERAGESARSRAATGFALEPPSLSAAVRSPLCTPVSLPLCPPRAQPQCPQWRSTLAPRKVLALGSCQNLTLLCPPGHTCLSTKRQVLLEEPLLLASEPVGSWKGFGKELEVLPCHSRWEPLLRWALCVPLSPLALFGWRAGQPLRCIPGRSS